MPAPATTRSPITAPKPRSTAAAATIRSILNASGGVTAINLAVNAGADETTGDTVAVINFQNVNASLFTTALTVTGSAGANVIIDGDRAPTRSTAAAAPIRSTPAPATTRSTITARKPRSTAAPASTRSCSAPASRSTWPMRRTRPAAIRPVRTSRTSTPAALAPVSLTGLDRREHADRRRRQRHDRRLRRRRYDRGGRRRRHGLLSRPRSLDRRRRRAPTRWSCSPRAATRRSISRSPPASTRPPAMRRGLQLPEPRRQRADQRARGHRLVFGQHDRHGRRRRHDRRRRRPRHDRGGRRQRHRRPIMARRP